MTTSSGAADPGGPTDGQLDLALDMLIWRYEQARHGARDARTLAACRLVAQYCLVLKRYPLAREYLEIALPLADELLGDDHPETVEIVGDLGHALLDLDELELAARYLRRQLAVLERGEPGEATLMPRNSLALALADLGETVEARRLLAVNLELGARLLGPGHRHTQTARANLASLDEGEQS